MNEDPVLRRRAQFARASQIGQRLGYLLFGAAMVLFIVGFAVGFTPGVVAAIVASLIVGSLLLAPAIVIAYAVRAAEKEDEETGR